MNANHPDPSRSRHWRRLAFVFLALWALTTGALVYLFVQGQTSAASDGRRAVQLSPSERDFVLMEMRRLLEAVHSVHGALASGDRNNAIELTDAAGMRMVREGAAIEESLLLKLPADMKAMGIGTHQQFDEVNRLLRSGASDREVAAATADLSARCVACHRLYRIR